MPPQIHQKLYLHVKQISQKTNWNRQKQPKLQGNPHTCKQKQQKRETSESAWRDLRSRSVHTDSSLLCRNPLTQACWDVWALDSVFEECHHANLLAIRTERDFNTDGNSCLPDYTSQPEMDVEWGCKLGEDWLYPQKQAEGLEQGCHCQCAEVEPQVHHWGPIISTAQTGDMCLPAGYHCECTQQGYDSYGRRLCEHVYMTGTG